jgi:hypothetical protein
MASESACIVRFISSMWRISSSRLLELGESEDHDDHDEDRDDATMWLRGSGGPYLVKVYFQPWSARHALMFLPGLLLQARVSACNAASPRSWSWPYTFLLQRILHFGPERRLLRDGNTSGTGAKRASASRAQTAAEARSRHRQTCREHTPAATAGDDRNPHLTKRGLASATGGQLKRDRVGEWGIARRWREKAI